MSFHTNFVGMLKVLCNSFSEQQRQYVQINYAVSWCNLL